MSKYVIRNVNGFHLKSLVSSGSLSDKKEDEVNAFRNRLRIKANGERMPLPCATFNEMPIIREIKSIILKNVEASRWKEPTPIQMQAIPVLLQGRDLLAAAPTGSGKTAAFAIPALSRLAKQTPNQNGLRILLLAPTKELADQIHREIVRLSEGRKFRICVLKKKIMKIALQQNGQQIFQKYEMLIATPLRLMTLIRAEAVDLSRVELVVLDEADRLLDNSTGRDDRDPEAEQVAQNNDNSDYDKEDDDNDEEEGQLDETAFELQQDEVLLGKRVRSAFLNQVDEILAQCSLATLQRALFSATLGPLVKELAGSFLHDPVEVSIGLENAAATTIKQRLVFVGREDGKLLAIRQLIQEGLRPPVLLFLQSIDRAKDLFKELIYDGINVDVMHAMRSAHQREEIMKRFRRGDIWILICTDLMARGIDFQGVQMVINYDLPQTAVSYIHRIGRTGRAGREGEAVTFFTEQDLPRIRPIANVVRLSGCEVPEWMLQIKPVSLMISIHFISK